MEKQIKRNANLKTHELEFTLNEEKDLNKEPIFKSGVIKVQEPDWETLCESFKWIYDENGKLDLITPGKLIFDLCVFELPDDLALNNRAMLSVCQQLTMLFVMPVNVEIKKK